MLSNGPEVVFEESLSDEWSQDLGVVEVPLDERPLLFVGLCAAGVALLIAGRIVYLFFGSGEWATARAQINLYQFERVSAPRGLIMDRAGVILAENKPVFSAVLDLGEFLRRTDVQERTLAIISSTLSVPSDVVWELVHDRSAAQSGDPIVLVEDLDQGKLVAVKSAGLSTIQVIGGFKRFYPQGEAMSSLLGYVGFPSTDDLTRDRTLIGQDLVGKSGLEARYDQMLRGTAGRSAKLRDAQGNPLGDEKKTDPQIGETLKLSIDTEFQKYFYTRFMQSLRSLGRTSGAGLAIDPRNGEVLAYLNLPSYNNNLFANTGHNDEKRALLTATTKPLFNRAVQGLYNPGSTIKPLDAVAALTEGVIEPGRTVYSPGYMDVPNPYDASNPSRFVDWRYQGNVNLYDAIAQSSNVYFYIVGGGSPPRDPALGPEWDSNFGVKGIGIERLQKWWSIFGLDEPTGIDLPGEATGFLPSPTWKEKRSGRSWLLGDTYNVSIGQGDLSVTPIALLNYITAIANGGTLYRPSLRETSSTVIGDLTMYTSAIAEVQKGMRRTVTSQLGSAHLLNDLPFPTAGKTGSAQVQNNTQENAFFVGYAPFEEPQIAILILVENSKEGSLNAVPIAKDVLNWYYEHRIKK